jgi:hypothetical protein
LYKDVLSLNIPKINKMTKELKRDLYYLLKKVNIKGQLDELEIIKLVVLAEEFIDSESHNYPNEIKQVINIKNFFEQLLKQTQND